MEYALADTYVFAKQSLDAILCGRFRLTPQGVHLPPAPLLPKLRGHFAEFLLRNSLEHLRLLASPTCVGLRYGRHMSSSAKLFLAACVTIPLRGSSPLRHRFSATPSGFAYSGTPTTLHRNPPPDGLLAPASLLRLEQTYDGTGMLTRFPSATPFGLTLGAD